MPMAASAVITHISVAPRVPKMLVLQSKIFNDQCGLVGMDYKMGGTAGYSSRRVLLAANGEPRTMLQDGGRKFFEVGLASC